MRHEHKGRYCYYSAAGRGEGVGKRQHRSYSGQGVGHRCRRLEVSHAEIELNATRLNRRSHLGAAPLPAQPARASRLWEGSAQPRRLIRPARPLLPSAGDSPRSGPAPLCLPLSRPQTASAPRPRQRHTHTPAALSAPLRPLSTHGCPGAVGEGPKRFGCALCRARRPLHLIPELRLPLLPGWAGADRDVTGVRRPGVTA